MATTYGNLSGDVTDIVGQDFARPVVRLTANTPYLIDPDTDEVRDLVPEWVRTNADGTFEFFDLIVGADTIVAGTLQYTFEVKAKGVTTAIGPFVLVAGDQDITDVEVVDPVDFNSPDAVDTGTLATAEAYDDAAMAAHVAAPDPHPQYVTILDGSGAVIVAAQIMVQSAGSPFPVVASIPDKTVLIRGGF